MKCDFDIVKWLLDAAERFGCIERKIRKIMATQQQLDAAIAALPGAIAAKVDAALQPVIDALIAKNNSTPIDFQPEIDALEAIAGSVSAQVTADLTPPVAPAPVVTQNADGSTTTVTTNADGTKTTVTKDASGNVIPNPTDGGSTTPPVVTQNADGSTTTVTTNADGTTTTETKDAAGNVIPNP